MQCFDLKRPDGTSVNTRGMIARDMHPFFVMQFYTFEYMSPISQGSSPHFDIRKQFEVELNDQLVEYMRTQVLKIDLLDDNVELNQVNGAVSKDYIGSVRIGLNKLQINSAQTEEIADNFPVKDHAGNEVGRIEVKIMCRDYQSGGIIDMMSGGKPGDTFTISRFAEREIIGKIAEKFADSLMQSIDMIFDMLIEPGSLDPNRISKLRFKDYILDITDSLREQDIDILLKTHPLLAGKDYLDLNDFRSLFEVPVEQARNKRVEDIAEREKSYMQAQKYFKNSTTGFNGMTMLQSANNFENAAGATFTKNPFLE